MFKCWQIFIIWIFWKRFKDKKRDWRIFGRGYQAKICLSFNNRYLQSACTWPQYDSNAYNSWRHVLSTTTFTLFALESPASAPSGTEAVCIAMYTIQYKVQSYVHFNLYQNVPWLLFCKVQSTVCEENKQLIFCRPAHWPDPELCIQQTNCPKLWFILTCFHTMAQCINITNFHKYKKIHEFAHILHVLCSLWQICFVIMTNTFTNLDKYFFVFLPAGMIGPPHCLPFSENQPPTVSY